ncbi:kinase-like domain-containing protein [Mycena haematopus]|nr:kinase-like domain-containing protein [Mycena haematopus]
MPSSAGGVVETFKRQSVRTPSSNRRAKCLERQQKQIVKQEREQKEQMPVYKGLENFNIVEEDGRVSRFPNIFLIGAFSNVYHAIDLTTNKKVAVKVVRKFELNASQVRWDKHLNPKFKKKPRQVQIMLMEGGELFHQIVKLTYFSENLSRHVILQVANGIRYLHEERGVVHRDIKPENLLFERIPIVPSKVPVHRPYDEEKEDEGEFIPGVGGGGIGRVKIADFGLSKVVWNEETMTPCGTVGYTAPEIVKDERYSKSVDMWALGCVLYTLLCGFPPFYDESINVLTEKVARGYYFPDSSAKDLITHLLCVDPAQRYTIDEFLAHPWCNAPAPPPPPTPYIYGHSLDSPLLSAAKGRAEGRSPGIATLKEAFDTPMLTNGKRVRAPAARQLTTGGRAGPRDRGRNAGTPRTKGFELDIDGATLLGRRHRGGKAAPGASGYGPAHFRRQLPPGSPMQVV